MTTWFGRTITASLLSAAMALPAAALAQAKTAPPPPPAAAAAPAPAAASKPAGPSVSAEQLTNEVAKTPEKAKPKIIDFEDETIRGTLTKPEGDFIDANKRAKQRSLIKIRRHFVPELLKSADDV